MLEIILVIALFSGIMHLIDKPYKKRIVNANTLEEALTQRKRLNRIRWGVSILFISLYIGIPLIFYNKTYGNYYDKNYTNVIAFTLYVLFFQNGFNKLKGNVSFSCKDDYLNKHQSYSLFLRGFDSDHYGIEIGYHKQNEGFNEYGFMNALMEYTPACAVGMTKEIDAPFGASRVYLNDDTWQSDVRELMEKSNSIFILVNERPSCIWEIEQSADFLDKVVFIVDDLDRYKTVKSQLKGKITFPDIDITNEEPPFCMRIISAPINISTENGTINDKIIALIYEFSNHEISYKPLVLRLLSKETIQHYLHRQKRKNRILLAVLFSVLLSLILLLFCSIRFVR